MKKLMALLLALVVVLGLVATGCSNDDEDTGTSGDTGEKKVVIGLSLPTQLEERWVRDKEKMEDMADELGVELKVQISNNDAAQQDSQARNLLAQGIDVLILAPHDAASAAVIVDAAEDEGVPVISYDRLITNTENVDVYISFDNVKVGELQGEYITNIAPSGNYIIMSGAPTDNNAKLFKEGAMKFIQPLIDSGDISVITDQAVDDWKAENALKIVENALTSADNDVDAILAPNDGTAGAAIQALAAQDLAGNVPITGQDAEVTAAQRIVEGTQTMTIFKDTRLLGEAAMKAAVELAKGNTLDSINGEVDNGKVNVPSILLTPYAVDKDNIDELLIESGYLKHEDVYK